VDFEQRVDESVACLHVWPRALAAPELGCTLSAFFECVRWRVFIPRVGTKGDLLGFEPDACFVDLATKRTMNWPLGRLMLPASVMYDLAGTASASIHLLAAHVAAGFQPTRDAESDGLAAVRAVRLA
jgi:hypothetical protein